MTTISYPTPCRCGQPTAQRRRAALEAHFLKRAGSASRQFKEHQWEHTYRAFVRGEVGNPLAIVLANDHRMQAMMRTGRLA